MTMVSPSFLITTTVQQTWITLWAVHLYPTGAVVYLNETSIVIPEGDDGNTTVDICIVLANVTRDLERDIVVDLTVMPDNANSKPHNILGVVQLVKMYLHL